MGIGRLWELLFSAGLHVMRQKGQNRDGLQFCHLKMSVFP